jgi:predicted extracellular nuclease/methionine-rich copper-binding protein CopC
VARASSVIRRMPLWVVVCVILVLSPSLLKALPAATVPQDINSLDTESGSWVINEIHAHPAADVAGDANGDGFSDPLQDEFIEVFNNSGAEADISGWALADQFGIRHQFPEGTLVPNRCAIVVFGGGVPLGEFGGSLVQVASSGSLGLDDSGDTITLSVDSIEVGSVSYGIEGNGDQALTRDPDIEGAFEGHLTASSPLGKLFSPGTRLDGTIFWGCPGYNAPPSVIETEPRNGESAAGINSTIAVTFSEPVSLNQPWNEILCTSSGVHMAVTNGSGDRYFLLPEEPFAYSETCQVTLYGTAINDVDEQPMEVDMQWQFTTEAEGDQAPEIVDSYPADGATGLPLEPVLTLTFSEPVDLAETAATLDCSQSKELTLQVIGGPSQFQLLPETELLSGERCTLTVHGSEVHDQDVNDPPDQMSADWQIHFSTDVTSLMLINEIDSETPGIDDAEFIELFDGGLGKTSLDGLAIVLFSGHDDSVYASFDLEGLQTDGQGFFLLGSSSIPGVDLVMSDSLLQNGPDAVALYRANATAFPVGSAVTTENLIDALVYDSGQETDAGLLPLMLAGELEANENSRDLDDLHSLQRCPNGSGGQRRTGTYWPDWPTPKEDNTCIKDNTPLIVGTIPADDTSTVPLESGLTITFSEEVNVYNDWFQIACENSGVHDADVSGDGFQFNLQPLEPFAYGEKCQATLFSEMVSDLDSNDPPDHLDADYSWSFTTIPARHVVINEVDADTEGIDTAEFIELFDGGEGYTALDGLLVVLFNGADDLSYRIIDLSDQQTDELGYFLIGSSAVHGVDLILPDSTLQNGPDAVALYAAQPEAIPNGSAIITNNLLDAVVYGTNDEQDDELLVLLAEGQAQVNEDGRDNGQGDSNQRCPDGSGGQRHSDSFLPNLPTPGNANKCTYDTAPFVTASTPDDQTVDVSLDTPIVITFNEPVDLLEGWIDFVCVKAGKPEIEARQSGNRVTLKPQESLLFNDACSVTILADRIVDSDTEDPPDQMAADFVFDFQTTLYQPSTHILINEVDADTDGVDTAEFIELYDGGLGNTLLDGLVIVLFNGSSNLSYASFDLDGFKTDGQGYFLLGNSAVARVNRIFSNGTLQNGPDAVAIYAGNADDFPNGTAVLLDNLLDALVYSTGEESAPGLLPLLFPSEKIVDEDGRGAKDGHSNQRCPNGTGGQRRTGAYLQNIPTPKEVNFCEIDQPPAVSGHTPPVNENKVALDTHISITFDEEVSLNEHSLQLLCTKSGDHGLEVFGGPVTYQFIPDRPLSAGETCSVNLYGDKVIDLDSNDPPDHMAGDYAWSFSTVPIPVARHVVINEVDADTEGIDMAEFIELFDGGNGNTALDGLEIVLFNGVDDQVYRRIDLAGQRTGATGYFVIGGSSVSGVNLVMPNNTIQNGPDAVALYVRDVAANDKPDQTGLLDALVYHTHDEPDPGLQFLLLENEPQVDEGTWRDSTIDSNQRCPNGQGDQRMTSGFVQNLPTPGMVNNCQIDKPPQITQVIPTDGALDIAVDSSLSVHFDEPVQMAEAWIQLSCKEGGNIDLVMSGGSQQYIIHPSLLAAFDSCKATVIKEKVFDLDGYADPLAEDYVWRFTTGKPLSGACGDEATPIHTVQGGKEISPLLDTAVIVEGVVVANYQGEEKLNGFFLQEEITDMDGDLLTSEGLFIADGLNTEEVTSGEILRLQGEVTELDGLTSLVNISSWQRCGQGTDVQPQLISLPLHESLSWEALEGMLVTFAQKLIINENDRWGSEGIVGLASERLYYPTMLVNPGQAAQEADMINQTLRVTLDDGSMVIDPLPYPPYLGLGNTMRLGDTADNITGIVTDANDGYRIQPSKFVNFKRDNPRPILAPLILGRMRVAHVNAGGYFNGDGHGQDFLPGHGAQSAVEYERQQTKLVNTIINLDASVIGLTGIENDGYGESSTLPDLVRILNEAAKEGDPFQIVEIFGGQQKGFADTAALIYRKDLVYPRGDPITLSDYPFKQLSRRPFAQHFTSIASGQEIIVVVVQFPERGNCPFEGNPNADQGDGQACWNRLRVEAAGSLAEWVIKQQAESGVEVLVIGDLRSYAKEDPLQALAEVGLANVEAQDKDEIGYSDVFDGQAGTLNYGLVTTGLKAKVSLVQRWHINADEPPALDYRETNQPLLYSPEPFRSAAQDPLVIDLSPDELSAAFTSNSSIRIGEPVSFINLSHGPQPLTYEWDFGDGTPLTSESEPVHLYEKTGTYTVTLTVKTSWGETAGYSAQVEVLPSRIYLPLTY